MARIRHKVANEGNLRQTGDMGNMGNGEFWFGCKSMRDMILSLVLNEFWFGILDEFFRDAWTWMAVNHFCERTYEWAIEDSNL